MADGNPFASQAPPGGNPFQQSFGSQGGRSVSQDFSMTSPYAPPPQSATPGPIASSQSPYGANPYGSAPYTVPQPPQQQQQQQYAPPNGYATSPAGTMHPGMVSSPPTAVDQSLVVSQYQSNPYAGYGPSAGLPSTGLHSGGSVASNPFDPFATAPAPPPQPPPPPPPQPIQPPGYGQPGGYAQPPHVVSPPPPAAYPNTGNDDLFADFQRPQQPPPPQPQQHQARGPPPQTGHQSPVRTSDQRYGETHQSTPPPRGQPYGGVDGPSPRNKYSSELARQAPPGASPLPKAELVRKKGYVLARISFRTIVIKKWKQSFWVQYGPHTMLWFRSEADFDDWLNNPYHTQPQRNFLIKLAVNFVHDLYKPNVRGYQVTQCRTKAYGNKMVRQFKLERWMDYGPTIAAAFGSYNPKEVDDLREALIECMRNTPLTGGIRATGAVRQNPSSESDQNEHYSYTHDDEPSRPGPQQAKSANSRKNNNYNNNNNNGNNDDDSEEADLLDVNNWDDVPSQTNHDAQYDPTRYALVPAQANPYGGPAPYPGAPYGYPSPNVNSTTSYSASPQGQYSNAIVPAGGATQGYPGAPPAFPGVPYPGATPTGAPAPQGYGQSPPTVQDPWSQQPSVAPIPSHYPPYQQHPPPQHF